MSDTVLHVENIYKQYRLGTLGSATLNQSLNRWWARVRGKEDPYGKIGENNRAKIVEGEEYVWALQNINFEVKQGEVLGIIGKNGAGKSTLLKILSQVTAPSIGQIKVRGRLAALLEVGTGFHPELTGRENIFLNGAILGMNRHEIRRKLDEIIDFSGVAKYIDTPVKRYSSGMYVRLAFAVAAHLEPDILIIDEVLAVGDVEFQEKCLGKMKQVSGEGRTVLFVSHNMSAVNTLCTRGIMLKYGQLVEDSVEMGALINRYLAGDSEANQDIQFAEWQPDKVEQNEYFRLDRFRICSAEGRTLERIIPRSTEIWVEISGEIFQPHPSLNLGFAVYNQDNQMVFWSFLVREDFVNYHEILQEGKFRIRNRLNKFFFNEYKYQIEFISVIDGVKWLYPSGFGPRFGIEIEGSSGSPLLAPRTVWEQEGVNLRYKSV